MTKYSILDLSPIPQGSTAANSLANTLDLARNAEAWGYTRFWLAEHHNMPGIASAATSVVIGHVAAGTRSIRVGSGGVMLPNHAPLVIAEHYGTLATLYPERIDLGLGRAPGTDGSTAWALRRNISVEDNFPRDVVELMGYLGESDPAQPVRAIPGEGTKVPIFMLGSSLYGAQLAAQLGLPYAFASHFAPAALDEALEIYRRQFRPSAALDQPYVILAANVFGAEDDAKGALIKSSMQLGFARLRSGKPGPLPAPVSDISQHVEPALLRMVNMAMKVSVEGSLSSVRTGLKTLINQYEPDEIIFNGQIHDHQDRLTSFKIAAEAMQSLNSEQEPDKRNHA